MRNTPAFFATRILPRASAKPAAKPQLLLTSGIDAVQKRLAPSSLSALNNTTKPTPSVWEKILDDMGYEPKPKP